MAARRKLNFWPLLVIPLLGGGGGYWYYRHNQKPEAPFRTAPVVRTDITEKVTATGTLQPTLQSPVGAQVSGIVWKIHADFNSTVKEGQVLVELEPALFKNEVTQAAAQVAQAQATVASAKANLAGAKAVRDRNLSLGKEGLAAVSDIDASNAAYAQSDAQVKLAIANVVQAQAQLEKAKLDFDHSVIRAPVDGTVISRSIDVGQAVAASFSAPTLFTVARDLAKMQVHAAVDEADIGKVKAGQEATFTVDAFRNETFKATVHEVRNSPTTTSNVVTYDVVLDVDNSKLRLRPGMTASVSLIIVSKPQVIAVPNEALRFRPVGATAQADEKKQRGAGPRGSSSANPAGSGAPPEGGTGGGKHGGGGSRSSAAVYVPDGEKAERIQVKTGVTDGNFTEVEGLEPGREVIIDSAQKAPAKASTGGFGRGV